mmetsp:Transcript_142738/g.456124  ORF Transcript_142738/g.456124 Transcript_142738/m.456124 type:complete len:151 (+) Transcript_142738:723-1175(+)
MDFTCLEMDDSDQLAATCHSDPQGLVMQVLDATSPLGFPIGAENAIQRFDEAAYQQMASYRDQLHDFTYLRLTELLTSRENLRNFRAFASVMHGGTYAEDEEVHAEVAEDAPQTQDGNEKAAEQSVQRQPAEVASKDGTMKAALRGTACV